jgi:hypothetical protein
LVGTAADPVKCGFAEYGVGRATAPGGTRSISGSRPRRHHPSDPGLKQSLIAAGGLHCARIVIDITIRFR